MIENAGIPWKYEKTCLDTSIYTEFHARADSDGQNPSKICQKSQNHAEITKFRFDPMNLNICSRRFQKSQSQYEKLPPNVEKSMISKCHFFLWRLYDMIWYDMIWNEMIWYDTIWYNMIWYDMTHDDII